MASTTWCAPPQLGELTPGCGGAHPSPNPNPNPNPSPSPSPSPKPNPNPNPSPSPSPNPNPNPKQVRSAAAAESVKILAQMHADEMASGCAPPQMRGGGFAAQAAHSIVLLYTTTYTTRYTLYTQGRNTALCTRFCASTQYIRCTSFLCAGVAHTLGGGTIQSRSAQLRRATSSVIRPGCTTHDGAARGGTATPHYTTLASYC